MKRFSVTFLLLTLLSAPVGATARVLAENLQMVCDSGDAEGCTSLGEMYREGEGVKQDYPKAAELYQKACNNGDARGCLGLSVMYEKGNGVKRSMKQAYEYIGKACELKHQPACLFYEIYPYYDDMNEE